MSNTPQKTATPQLIHHPSNVLDGLGDYSVNNAAWVLFDLEQTRQLKVLETRFRHYWTRKAVRQSLGR